MRSPKAKHRSKRVVTELDAAAALAQVPLSWPRELLLERLLYRDGLILIIDKPAGLAVHAGPKGGETLTHYLAPLQFGLPDLPELGHRLDRDTSGCLALGRHKKALRRLGKLFQSGQVQKTYSAIVQGRLPANRGRIEAALTKRSTASRGWWMEVAPEGQAASTDYVVMATSGGSNQSYSLVELRPKTGRTHQLRVHLAHLGCPIVGDPMYGGPAYERMLLHATQLALPLYPNKPAIDVTASAPAEFAKAIREFDLQSVS